MTFKAGQSGNPGGRPKETADVRILARKHTELALKTLIEVARDKKQNGSARTAAAVALLDRGYGKPAQALEHSGEIKTGIGELLEAIDGRTRGLPNGG